MITYLTLPEITEVWIALESGELEDAEIQSDEERRAAQRVCELLIDKAGTYGENRPHPTAVALARKARAVNSEAQKAAARKNGYANSPLTPKQVRAIRRSRDSYSQIAKKFGVNKSTIGDIKTRKTWAHI